MAANRSFTEYVKDRFYNNLYSAVENYTEQNINNLDLRLQKIINIGEVSLIDIEIKWVVISNLPGMKIEFDVVVDAGIEVTERNYRYDDVDECSQWFMVRCRGFRQ